MGKAHANAYRNARVHDLAAAAHAAARLDRRPRRGGGQRGGAAATASSATSPTGTSSSPIPRSSCFDNSGPNNLHAEPTIAAAEAGKHVFCEKPLGRTADESYEIWQRVAAAGVKHMTAFNYRFVPAVRLARQMIEAGELGEIHHFRGRYLQEWGTTTDDAWRFHARRGRLGRARRPRRARDRPRALPRRRDHRRRRRRRATFMPGREVDDAFEAVVEFEGGAVGTIEATRFAAGPQERVQLGDQRLEGLARVRPRAAERAAVLARGRKGFRTILVSEADHPFWEWWWPHGHMIGWEHTFVHEIHHLLDAIANDARGRAARRDVRGRLPRRRGVRRGPPLRGVAPAGDDHVPLRGRPCPDTSCGQTRVSEQRRLIHRPEEGVRRTVWCALEVASPQATFLGQTTLGPTLGRPWPRSV